MVTDNKSNKNYTLSDIQKRSVDRLLSMRAAVLALSAGTGKTLTILHTVSEVMKDNNDKCLFFIPKSARAAFEKELTTKLGFSNKDYILIKAGKVIPYSEFSKYRYILIENTLVNKYVEDLVTLANNNNCHLVIDEAHSLQNPESVFSKAAWEVRCYCKRVYAMTATPLMNSIDGLFNLYHFVFPGVFVSWYRFRARYCITKENVIRMKGRNGKVMQRKVIEIIGYQNLKELTDTLDKLTIKGCVHYNVNFEFLECELDAQSEKPYRFASNGLFDSLYHPEKAKARAIMKKAAGDQNPDEVKDFGSRLHDLARVVDVCDVGDNDPEFISNKMWLLINALKKVMRNNESSLVYFEYMDSLEMAERILLSKQEEIGFNKIYRLTGAEKEELRASIEKNLGLREIILCSQAASQSRNLDRANHLIIFNCPFSLGRLIQCSGRICRVSSTYDHQDICILSVKDTIDEYKVTLFKDHLSLISKLLGDEGTGVLSDCEYLDIDRANMKELKNNLLWCRNKR